MCFLCVEMAFEYLPCKPAFFRRFINKHSTINVTKRIEPATVEPAINKTIGLVSLAGSVVLATTLGSIGDGVDGSENKIKRNSNQHLCFKSILEYNEHTQCFAGDNCHEIRSSRCSITLNFEFIWCARFQIIDAIAAFVHAFNCCN